MWGVYRLETFILKRMQYEAVKKATTEVNRPWALASVLFLYMTRKISPKNLVPQPLTALDVHLESYVQ